MADATPIGTPGPTQNYLGRLGFPGDSRAPSRYVPRDKPRQRRSFRSYLANMVRGDQSDADQ
jgi:hypothetical protein